MGKNMSKLSDLTTSFKKATQSISKTLITSSLLAAAITSSALADSEVGSHITTIPSDSNKPILAHEDPKIMANCPQAGEIELVNIPAKNLPFKKILLEAEINTLPPTKFMSSTEEIKAVNILQHMWRANKGELIALNINSSGGDLDVANTFAFHAQNTSGIVATYGHHAIMSAATLILFSGTPGYRNVASSSEIIIHAARGIPNKDVNANTYNRLNENTTNDSDINFVFEGDYTFNEHDAAILKRADSADTEEMKNTILQKANLTNEDLLHYRRNEYFKTLNSELIHQYQKLSTENITKECTKNFIQGRLNFKLSPKTALGWGLVDAVFDYDKEKGMSLGTMTVRRDDPRAVAYFETQKDWILDTKLPQEAANDSHINKQRIASYSPHP